MSEFEIVGDSNKLILVEDIRSDGASFIDGARPEDLPQGTSITAQIQQYSDGLEVILGDLKLAERCRRTTPFRCFK